MLGAIKQKGQVTVKAPAASKWQNRGGAKKKALWGGSRTPMLRYPTRDHPESYSTTSTARMEMSSSQEDPAHQVFSDPVNTDRLSLRDLSRTCRSVSSHLP